MFTKSTWIELLRRQLPGEKAHLMMAPTFRGEDSSGKKAMQAAVLVLFYPSGGKIHLAFIKRNEYDGPHSAQVSFPGGAREKGDHSLEETAVRETREELGIREQIEVLGALTPLHIPVSNFLVFPYVAWMDEVPEFRPDPTEVQYVIEAPLSTLLDPSNIARETLLHHGTSIEVPFYKLGEEKIWGATAMMLSEVLLLSTNLQ